MWCNWGTITPCASDYLSSLISTVIILTLTFPLVRSSSIISSQYILLEWCSCDSTILAQMRRRRPNKWWYGLLSFMLGYLNERFLLLHCHHKREEGWTQKKYYVTCRPRQHHYFHCTWIYPSGGGASRFWGSTLRRAHVLSRPRRQRRRSLFPFLLKVDYVMVPVDQYLWLNNAPGILSQHIVVHSVYILYVLWWFLMIHLYLWYTLFIWYHFCSLEYYYFDYVFIVILSYSIFYCSFNILFWSSFLFISHAYYYKRSDNFFSISISTLKYKHWCKIYHYTFTISCTYYLIY